MPRCYRRWRLGAALLFGALLLSARVSFGQENAPQKWALLIGIDQYEDANRIAGLGGAARDARSVKAALVEAAGVPEDHVSLLTSDGDVKPTRTNILNGLARLVKNAKPGDTVFVLYSGHGIEVEGKPYLLPYDTSAIDDATITDTALEKNRFDERLRQVKAKALILAFDMCRSNPRKGTRDVAGKDNKLSKSLSRGLDFSPSAANTAGGAQTDAPVVVTLFSCSEGERSYEWQDQGRGYFSWYLEQGLRGKAAAGAGKPVTVEGLVKYLQAQVSSAVARNEGAGAKQTPYPELRGPGAGGFVLASRAAPAETPAPRPKPATETPVAEAPAPEKNRVMRSDLGFSYVTPDGYKDARDSSNSQDLPLALTGPALDGTFTTNINLVTQAAQGALPPGIPADDEIAAIFRGQIPDYAVAAKSRLKVGGLDALAFSGTFTLPQLPTEKIQNRQVLVIREGKLYTFTFTSLAREFPERVKAFDRMLSSLRWLKTPAGGQQ